MVDVLTDARDVPITRACKLVGLPRSTYYYEPTEREPRPVDPEVRELVLDVCRERPSFGYRRVTAMVRRRLGEPVNHKKVYRIMRIENLTLEPCVQPRERVRKTPGEQITDAPDEVYQADLKYVWVEEIGWTYLHTIIDCCTSQWLAYVYDLHCGAREAIRLLDNTVMKRFPDTCRVPGTKLSTDNGPGFKARRFRDHAKQLGFEHERIGYRSPEENGVVESLHAGLDRDYFRHVVFDTTAEAREYIAWAFEDYNTIKPQERLDWMTPNEYYEERMLSAK